MTQAEIQSALRRFAAPLAPYAASSPERREVAEILVKALWLALIGGPEVEEETWKVLEETGHLEEEGLQTIKDCYYQRMKSQVSEEQLVALRERYTAQHRGT